MFVLCPPFIAKGEQKTQKCYTIPIALSPFFELPFFGNPFTILFSNHLVESYGADQLDLCQLQSEPIRTHHLITLLFNYPSLHPSTNQSLPSFQMDPSRSCSQRREGAERVCFNVQYTTISNYTRLTQGRAVNHK